MVRLVPRLCGLTLLGLALLCLTLLPAPVAAEPEYTLRFASIVPEGTAWAREMHAMARDVALATDGKVSVRWYLGGIAGDDVEAGKRIARDQLDGVAAGSWQCERWAPSVSVTRLPGLFHSREESKYVASRLRPLFEEEFARAGFVYLGDSPVGPSLIFTRAPVSSMEELTRTPLWALDNDVTKLRLLRAFGLTLVPLPFDQSRAAYDDRRVDGFLAPATGALAFQWSTQARYLLADLPTDYILGCVVIATRSFDRLPFELQQTVRTAAAKFAARFDDAGAHADDELLGGLFERQGLRLIHPDAKFRAAFDAAARAAWETVTDKGVPRALLMRVRAFLTAYRAANPTR